MFRPDVPDLAGLDTGGGPLPPPDFVVIDVETACARVSSICQIGIVGFRGGTVAFEYETLVDPMDDFSSFNSRIHGITAAHVAGQPRFTDVHGIIDGYLGGCITVAHSYFDKGALAAACRVHDRAMVETRWLDSVRVAKRTWPHLSSHRLNVVAHYLGIPLRHHDAMSDARAAGMIVVKAMEHSGLQLSDWLMPPARKRLPSVPEPAAEGVFTGERVAILGQSRDGPLAQRIANHGGRIMASVGKGTTMLVVVDEEPFGYIRYDAQFRKARDYQEAGGAIRILSQRALLDLLTP